MQDAIIYLDPESSLNLQNQIRQKLVDGILNGAFPPSMKLPSSRSLARQLDVARWSIPVMALIALYTAFNTSTVISAIAISISLGFAGMSAPFILAIWWKKLNSTGGFSGIGAGFAAFALMSVLYPDIPASLVGFWVSLVVAVTASLLTQKKDPPKSLTNADGEAMELSNRLGTLPLFRRAD